MKIFITILSLAILTNVSAENAFEKNYKSQGDVNFMSLDADSKAEIYRGWDKDKDNVLMLEQGFDLMGFSSFVGTYVPPSEALDFANKIKADTVLVYDRQINEATRATAIKKARENIKRKKLDEEGKIEEIVINKEDLVDPNVMFDFYVSFWAKLPKPLFGTHLINFPENDERGKDGGLFVIAVIKDSVAANAGILRKDSIMKINDIDLVEPQDFIKELINNKGRDVKIDYKRDGEMRHVVVSI